MTAEEARRAVARIREVAITFDNPSEIAPVLRDPNDDYLVALATQSEADAIVSGDNDLLDHSENLKPPAISAREACELLGLRR